MGLFRFRKASATESSSDSLSATSWSAKFRFHPFSRNSSRNATVPIQSTPGEANNADLGVLRRANTTSTISQMSTMQVSIAGSRPPSETFCVSPVDTSFTPTLPTRSASMYSHRSYSIRRDSIKGRPPVLPRPSQADMLPPGQLPSTCAEDELILTNTSRYPIGIAAELYIPEDCTYTTVTQREKEARRQDFREQLKRNASINRSKSIMNAPEEKKRLQRISVNF